MNPKKLVRAGMANTINANELETITSREELNPLYALKIKEELAEIQASDHSDIFEFVDLMDVVVSFAMVNGFKTNQLALFARKKCDESGGYGNLVLKNLNPNNPSNKIYFERSYSKDEVIKLVADFGNRINTDSCLGNGETLEKAIDIVKDCIKWDIVESK